MLGKLPVPGRPANLDYSKARGVLLTWITVGQGPIVLAVCAAGVV